MTKEYLEFAECAPHFDVRFLSAGERAKGHRIEFGNTLFLWDEPFAYRFHESATFGHCHLKDSVTWRIIGTAKKAVA
jgi:hypothetical protein